MCVYETFETGLLLLLVCIALLLLPLSFVLGVGAPSLSLVGFIFVIKAESGSTWLIVILMVRCCFGGLCVHYKTNSRIIRRIIRFGLVLELSGW